MKKPLLNCNIIDDSVVSDEFPFKIENFELELAIEEFSNNHNVLSRTFIGKMAKFYAEACLWCSILNYAIQMFHAKQSVTKEE